jgi:tetratricopeptide (TPR) repeat protein
LTIEKTAVFISSRFAEFAEFRQLLARKINEWEGASLQAIEMNDNGAGTQAPSLHCISLVKRSELMVLLLGDSYGPLAQGHQLSHTHLEYRASQDEDSDARVLPYFIRAEPVNGTDSALEEFCLEVQRNHRTASHPRPDSAGQWEVLAQEVFTNVLRTLWEMRLQEAKEETEDDWELDDPMPGIPDTELFQLRLRPRSELATMLRPAAADTLQEALRHPRALAAEEQLGEARIALQIGERGIAQRHLREAVNLRPLDPIANEWLARVLLSKGSTRAAQDAVPLAHRAARIYSKTGMDLRSAASLVLAARAASLSDSEMAIAYARAAVEEASWYAQTHYELARQLCLAGDTATALTSVRRAYSCHPPSIDGAQGDFAFAGSRPALDGLIKELHQELNPVAAGIQAAEAELRKRLRHSPATAPELYAGPRLSRRVFACRDSVRRQMQQLQELANEYLYISMLNAAPDAPRHAYLLDAATLGLHAQETIEITSPPAAGATFAQGQQVFQYRGANGRGGRAWLAPVALKVAGVARETALRGNRTILTWTPAVHDVSAVQHQTKLAEEETMLNRAEHDHATHAAQQRSAARMLGLTGVCLCAAVAGAILWRSNTMAPWMGGIAALYLAHKANQFRERRSAAAAVIQRCLARIGMHKQSISTEQQHLSALRQEMSRQRTHLLEMIAVFERQALSLLSVAMPFAALRTAREGDWVAVAPATVGNYAASFGATVQIDDDPDLPGQPGKLLLLRVMRREGNLISLDRKSAWFPLSQF